MTIWSQFRVGVVICNMFNQGWCFTFVPRRRQGQTGSVRSHLDQEVRISLQGTITPSRRPHPFNPCSGAYESQCCWHVKSQVGKESLPRPPEQKNLISKWMLGEQPSSAGRRQSAPDHSVRDSWSPKQFLLHGSFSLETTLPFQISPHLPLLWPMVSGIPTLFSSFHSLRSFIWK